MKLYRDFLFIKYCFKERKRLREDRAKYELSRAPVTYHQEAKPITTYPPHFKIGDTWIRSSDSVYHAWDGNDWVQITWNPDQLDRRYFAPNSL